MEDKIKSAFISIVGEPNVGKSSLMNAMIGCKASIVSPKPQTTRRRIKGILTIGSTQLVFTDTPGIHKPDTGLEKYMLREAETSFFDSGACFHVVSACNRMKYSDMKIMSDLKGSNIPIILVINKIDLISDKSLLIDKIEEFNRNFKYFATVPVSAKTGNGIERLIKETLSLASPSEMFFDKDDFTDQPERVLVSEIIREKLLKFLDKEVPYGTAVVTDGMKSGNGKTTDIFATVICERESHKGIIIGKGGSMLKRVGVASREEIEEILGKKINLRILVKVKENWRNRVGVLKDLGYFNEVK